MADKVEKSTPRSDEAMTSNLRKKIALIYIDSGGGHRAAANALCEVIRREERPWDMQMLCIQELLIRSTKQTERCPLG
jgi:hypothetical protein